ncbi:HAMP domain-containing protein, partial [Thioalkalivibrio sp. XN279]|uniref:HAMP domain-containing protein n=1 Tax=Thioalkalivibrio sp. XN279 TaxID=2714953 RepID=UPI00140CF464
MFRKLTITAKLYGVLGILSLVLIGIGFTGVRGMQALTVEMEDMYQMGLEGTASLGRMESMFKENLVELFDAAQHDPRLENTFADGHQVDRHFTKMRERSAQIIAELEEYLANHVATDAGRQAAAELETARAAYVRDALVPVLDMMEAGNFDAASDFLIATTLPAFRTSVLPRIEAMVTQKAEFAGTQYAGAVAQFERQRMITIVSAGLGLLLAGFIGWLVISRSFARPVSQVVEAADKMAAGNFDFQVKATNPADEVGQLVEAVNRVQASVKGMVADANMLAKAAVEGRLATRADADKHEGEFRDIVAGVNNTLDAVIGPLNVAAGYVDRISKGDIPEKITDEYKGDFNALKNNLNTCINAVNALVRDANMLSEAALAGKLETRADASHHQGDFRKIVDGVNATLDAVVGPINQVKRVMVALADGDLRMKIDGTYHGDFKVLQEAVNESMDKLNELMGGIKSSADTINTAA